MSKHHRSQLKQITTSGMEMIKQKFPINPRTFIEAYGGKGIREDFSCGPDISEMIYQPPKLVLPVRLRSNICINWPRGLEVCGANGEAKNVQEVVYCSR